MYPTMGITMIPLTISCHLYFPHISKVRRMLHEMSVGRVQCKECFSLFTYTFLPFLLFFITNLCFYDFMIFIFFSFLLLFSFFLFFCFFCFEVSNFQNRILTNQKPELTIRNCHWNFMFGLKVAINSALYYNSSFPLLLLSQKLFFLTNIFHVFLVIHPLFKILILTFFLLLKENN